MPLSLMLAILLSASTAFLAAVALRSLALRRGWVSRAVAQRAGPGGIPVAGGLAVLLAMAAGCCGSALLGALPCGGGAHLAGIGVLLAGFALVGAGDDCRSLSPWGRLAAEALLAAAAATLLSAGMPAGAGDPAGASGGRAGWGHPVLLAAAMVAGANAFNLVDNSDGLAAGVAALSFAGLAWMGIEPLLFGSAAAALGGFWLLNRPPARLYLGDHGTLPLGGLLGLGLAALAGAPGEQGMESGPGVAGALLAAGYVLWDPAYTLARRMGSGRRPWIGGVDHLAHDLARASGAWPPVLAFLLGLQLLSVAAAACVEGGALHPVAGATLVLLWPGLLLGYARAAKRLRVDPRNGL